MKNDPVALRAQAKRLMEQAERLEKEKFARVGRLVVTKYLDRDFTDFDVKKFKEEIAAEAAK
jgi:uncharacterized protein (UPF0335 family)